LFFRLQRTDEFLVAQKNLEEAHNDYNNECKLVEELTATREALIQGRKAQKQNRLERGKLFFQGTRLCFCFFCV
jgi:hypothetical protein